MRWYVSRTGQAEGPFEETAILQWIRGGGLPDGSVCPEGGNRWTALAQTPPFSALFTTPSGAGPNPAAVQSSAQVSIVDAPQTGASAAPGASGPPAAPPSSGVDGLPLAPWAVPEHTPGLGKTHRMGVVDVEQDRAWRDTPGVVNRIGQRTPSQIPPSGELEISKIEPPLGTRTPSEPLHTFDTGGPLPPNAPAWMHHAQRMIAGLQQALKQVSIDASTEASIERAWAGWELDGSSERQIARMALLVEQTHTALREVAPHRLERAIYDCAEVLRQGMPKHARRKMPLDEVVRITREMPKEVDPWVSVVHAVAALLGWQKTSIAYAAHAIRLAIQNTRSRA